MMIWLATNSENNRRLKATDHVISFSMDKLA
jgi:hypothetical protein